MHGMRLNGKKALVTGASRGIGAAIALAYADEGAELVITGRKADTLEETAAAVRAKGARATILEWDVAHIAIAAEKTAEAVRALGGLHIAVNNAGVVRLDGSRFPDVTEAEWDFVLGINLKGLYFACQEQVKVMTEQGGGTIINVASDAGLRPEVNPYGISKWGVVAVTKGMGKTLAKAGIRVNALAPGPAATDMMNWRPGDALEFPGLPLGRLALAEEIAAAAVFLASEESAAVHGDVLVLNSATS